MRALLAKKIASNITRNTKAVKDCSFTGFTSDCSSYLVINGNHACLNSNNGYAFTKPVKVTPQNGNPVEGVYMVVGGCYLIEFPNNFKEDEAIRVSPSSETKDDKSHYIEDFYFVSKKEADLNLKYKIEYSDIKKVGNDYEANLYMETNYFIAYNPNKFSAEADVDDDFYVLTGNDNPILLTSSNSKINDIKLGKFRIDSEAAEEADVEGKDSWDYSASTTVKVKGNDLGDFPEKTWKIRSGIFTKDTPDDDLPGKGLSAGAIAGIVIACVVVVGIVVFCIVWFVVLKKGCCCSKKVSNPDS